MAQKYGFFNSINNDRVYDASEVANFLSKFFTNGVFNNSLAVSSNDNMTVSVAIGSANINGYAYENTEVLTLDIDEADSTLSRIDSVICRLDLTNRQITTMILQGNYANTASQPNITRTGNIYDLRLANVSVPAGATRITADMITDTRFGSDCGNVVGTVQQIDTTDVFNQYETYFNNWFKTLEDELSENQAGNLQNQINNLNNLVNENDDKVGNLNDLNTTDKSSIVNAINEITPNSITGYLASQLSYTSDKSPKLIPLTLNSVKGTKLSITADGGVKIGAGVDKILVNAQVYFFTGSNHQDGKNVFIYKNTTSVGRGARRDNYNYIFIPAGPFLLDVEENDVIYLYCSNDVNGSTVIGNGVMNTFMNVLVV